MPAHEHLHPAAMLTLVRAAAFPAGDPEGHVPEPVSLRRVDRYPDVILAWVYGTAWHAAGRVADAEVARQGTEAWRTGELAAVVRWGDSLAEGGWCHPAEDADVFITGAYLVALGRLPDAEGRATHVERCSTEGFAAVLESLVASQEARQRLRFPSQPADGAALLAEAVRAVVGGPADPGGAAELLVAARDGRPVDWLVRTALRLHHGAARAALRRPLVPSLVRQVHLSVGLMTVLDETDRQSALLWRMFGDIDDRLDRVHSSVEAQSTEAVP